MAAPKHLFFLLLLLSAALWAKAGVGKTEGVLNGYVRDAVTKKPLPGVVVSATIPGTNHQQAVLTDSAGYFHFVELPSAAQITIEFNKKGYQPAKRPNISIKEKTPVKINVEFHPEDEDAGSDSELPMLHMLQAS